MRVIQTGWCKEIEDEYGKMHVLPLLLCGTLL